MYFLVAAQKKPGLNIEIILFRKHDVNWTGKQSSKKPLPPGWPGKEKQNRKAAGKIIVQCAETYAPLKMTKICNRPF